MDLMKINKQMCQFDDVQIKNISKLLILFSPEGNMVLLQKT